MFFRDPSGNAIEIKAFASLDQLFAPGQAVALVSGWQLPFISIFTSIQFLLPLFIAVMAAEMIGAEVAHGTLAPLLLRPVDRTRVILSKLIVAITYPFVLLLVTLLGSLIAGLPLGYGNFQGGTGLGAGGLVGVGTLTSEAHVIFGNLKALLESAGSSLDRLVQVHALIYDSIEYDVLNRVYRQYVANGPPARTVWSVQIEAGFKIQLDVTAAA